MDRGRSLRWWQFGLRHLALLTLVVAVACWWRLQDSWPNDSTGKFFDTGNPLDVAIEGRGYFVCAHPMTNATIYTRRGNLSINTAGQICVGPGSEGCLLEPCITIPPSATNVTIATDGNVYYYTQGGVQATSAGQIMLASFMNPNGLKPFLHALPGFLKEGDDSGQPTITPPGTSGAGWLQSTFLEAEPSDGWDAMHWLLIVLCSLVGWLAWEVRKLGAAIRARPVGAEATQICAN